MIWLGLFIGLLFFLPWATVTTLGAWREYQVARLAAEGGGTFMWMGMTFTVTPEDE